MKDWIEWGKGAATITMTGVAAMFAPIQEMIYLLAIGFFLHIFLGISADANVNKVSFSLSKAFDALKMLAFYVVLIYYLNRIGGSMNLEYLRDEGVKGLTLLVIYYYVTSSVKNASLMFPNNWLLTFLYLLLTTQVFTKLKEFFGLKS